MIYVAHGVAIPSDMIQCLCSTATSASLMLSSHILLKMVPNSSLRSELMAESTLCKWATLWKMNVYVNVHGMCLYSCCIYFHFFDLSRLFTVCACINMCGTVYIHVHVMVILCVYNIHVHVHMYIYTKSASEQLFFILATSTSISLTLAVARLFMCMYKHCTCICKMYM